VAAASSLENFFYPEDRGDNVPPKRRFTQYLYGAASQKAAFFIVTAVKTSNLTLL
jgi:hypothetical protein